MKLEGKGGTSGYCCTWRWCWRWWPRTRCGRSPRNRYNCTHTSHLQSLSKSSIYGKFRKSSFTRQYLKFTLVNGNKDLWNVAAVVLTKYLWWQMKIHKINVYYNKIGTPKVEKKTVICRETYDWHAKPKDNFGRTFVWMKKKSGSKKQLKKGQYQRNYE